MLAVAVLLSVGAPLVGLVTAVWAHDEARHTVREQRADRRSVRAEVVGMASDTLRMAESARHPAAKVTVRWTEPGEAPRTAAARVPAGTRTGETVDVWLDSRVAAILAGHGVVRRAAMRRRLDEWERAWARTEPQWTGRRA